MDAKLPWLWKSLSPLVSLNMGVPRNTSTILFLLCTFPPPSSSILTLKLKFLSTLVPNLSFHLWSLCSALGSHFHHGTSAEGSEVTDENATCPNMTSCCSFSSKMGPVLTILVSACGITTLPSPQTERCVWLPLSCPSPPTQTHTPTHTPLTDLIHSLPSNVSPFWPSCRHPCPGGHYPSLELI